MTPTSSYADAAWADPNVIPFPLRKLHPYISDWPAGVYAGELDVSQQKLGEPLEDREAQLRGIEAAADFRAARGYDVVDDAADEQDLLLADDLSRQLLALVPEDSDSFSWDLMDRMIALQGLIESKHHDYGPHNIARSPGGPLNGLRVRMHDKLARINHLVDNGAQPEHESLRDSFVDMAGYAVIGLLVIDGVWPGE